MRKPTKRAIRLKPRATITKSWEEGQGSEPVEAHFEWFVTKDAQSGHFDRVIAWAEKDVADHGAMFHLSVEMVDTERMTLGRSHIVPSDNDDLKAALKAARADPESLLTVAPAENTATCDLVDLVGRLGGDGITIVDDRSVNFVFGDVECVAYLKDGSSRIRGSAFLDPDVGGADAKDWVVKQPQPQSGRLQVGATEGDNHVLRLLFERSVNDDGIDDDPLCDEVQTYADAWRDRTAVQGTARTDYVLAGDPRDLDPANAWLLLGDAASFPGSDDLLEHAALGRAGIFEYLWTTSKQTDVGDLMLMYFIAPHKAAHFVARSASRAFFDPGIGVNAMKTVANEQWWCYLTTPIEIKPIPFAALNALAGGHFPLHGKSGVYLRPDLVGAIPVEAKNAGDEAELMRVLRPLVGRADLPPAGQITAELWPTIASGILPLESQVEQYLVEPLLRLTLNDHKGVAWHKSFKIGAKVADYVVTGDGAAVCVVEVKVAVREAFDGIWTHSKDFLQVRGYADALKCASALIDANRIYLVDKNADQPHRIFDRRNCTQQDLKAIGAHFRGAS